MPEALMLPGDRHYITTRRCTHASWRACPARAVGPATVNLQQLRYLCAVVDHGLNVSDAAAALFTSQPGISKQIRQLEDELGVEVFVRQGKRLAALTPAGAIVVATARRALVELANLKRVAEEFRSDDEGELASRPRTPRRATCCRAC